MNCLNNFFLGIRMCSYQKSSRFQFILSQKNLPVLRTAYSFPYFLWSEVFFFPCIWMDEEERGGGTPPQTAPCPHMCIQCIPNPHPSLRCKRLFFSIYLVSTVAPALHRWKGSAGRPQLVGTAAHLWEESAGTLLAPTTVGQCRLQHPLPGLGIQWGTKQPAAFPHTL